MSTAPDPNGDRKRLVDIYSSLILSKYPRVRQISEGIREAQYNEAYRPINNLLGTAYKITVWMLLVVHIGIYYYSLYCTGWNQNAINFFLKTADLSDVSALLAQWSWCHLSFGLLVAILPSFAQHFGFPFATIGFHRFMGRNIRWAAAPMKMRFSEYLPLLWSTGGLILTILPISWLCFGDLYESDKMNPTCLLFAFGILLFNSIAYVQLLISGERLVIKSFSSGSKVEDELPWGKLFKNWHRVEEYLTFTSLLVVEVFIFHKKCPSFTVGYLHLMVQFCWISIWSIINLVVELNMKAFQEFPEFPPESLQGCDSAALMCIPMDKDNYIPNLAAYQFYMDCSKSNRGQKLFSPENNVPVERIMAVAFSLLNEFQNKLTLIFNAPVEKTSEHPQTDSAVLKTNTQREQQIDCLICKLNRAGKKIWNNVRPTEDDEWTRDCKLLSTELELNAQIVIWLVTGISKLARRTPVLDPNRIMDGYVDQILSCFLDLHETVVQVKNGLWKRANANLAYRKKGVNQLEIEYTNLVTSQNLTVLEKHCKDGITRINRQWKDDFRTIGVPKETRLRVRSFFNPNQAYTVRIE